MAENTPLVSIVLPSWEKGIFLRQALDSIILQTYPKIEIIVQDNQSKDETRTILNEYRDKIDKIVIEKDNGQTDALRRGFENCQGEILAWLNADDILMPDSVRRVVEIFHAEPQPQIVYGHCALLTARGQFLRYFNSIQPFSIGALLNRPNIMAQPSTFFLRQCYEETGGLDSQLSFLMDWDLWCKFGKAGYRFQFLDEVLSGARIYKETKSQSGGIARLAEILRVNGRHKTTFLPLGTMGYFYVDYLRPRARFLGLGCRWLRKRLLRNGDWSGAIVKGIDSQGLVVSPNFKIQFPLYAIISDAKLYLTCRDGSIKEFITQSILNSFPGDVKDHTSPGQIVIQWDFNKPLYLKAVDLEVTTKDLEDVRGKVTARLDLRILDAN